MAAASFSGLSLTPAGVRFTAHRVGIVPWAPCPAVLNQLAASAPRELGVVAGWAAAALLAGGILLRLRDA